MALRGYSMRLRDVRLLAVAYRVADLEERHALRVIGADDLGFAARAVLLALIAGGALRRAADAARADPAQAHGVAAVVPAHAPVLHLAVAGAVAGMAPSAVGGGGTLRERDACGAVVVAHLTC